jgi:hypothetical protein
MSRLYSGIVLLIAATLLAGDAPADKHAASKERLAKLQPLVGSWRGAAQPQRGSAKDSWIEEADWAWSFAGDEPALVATLPKAKYFSRLRLRPDASGFVLTAKPMAGGDDVRYAGTLDDQGQLIVTAVEPRDELPRRLSFRFVAGGDRLLVLMEKGGATSDSFIRLAEAGLTRQGSGFGKNVAQRECIVTGGLGTIEVTHNGKTYYVCCTGCRDYFNENAEKVLAEHAAKKDAEKAAK